MCRSCAGLTHTHTQRCWSPASTFHVHSTVSYTPIMLFIIAGSTAMNIYAFITEDVRIIYRPRLNTLKWNAFMVCVVVVCSNYDVAWCVLWHGGEATSLLTDWPTNNQPTVFWAMAHLWVCVCVCVCKEQRAKDTTRFTHEEFLLPNQHFISKNIRKNYKFEM